MPSMQIIDELDRCKTALQVVAEMQSGGLATLLDFLIENLDSAIGQVQAQLSSVHLPGPILRPRRASPPAPRRYHYVPTA